MAITKVHLGWEKSCLDGVVDFLLSDLRTSPGLSVVDLRNHLMVLPSSRGARRLTEMLVQRCADRDLGLLPPQTITIGRLPECFYTPDFPAAGQLERWLAWSRVLHQLSPGAKEILFSREVELDDFAGMLRLSQQVDTLATQLQGAGNSFAQVVKIALQLSTEQEASRWEVLAELEEQFLEHLKSNGRGDLYCQRLQALKTGIDTESSLRIMLLSTVEIPSLVCRVLDQLPNVTTLVHAPLECAEGFDQYGRIKSSWWADQKAEIPIESIAVVDKPHDQAEKAIRFISEAVRQAESEDGSFPADDVVVGVADKSIEPVISGHLSLAGITVRKASGEELLKTGPGELLAAVARLLVTNEVHDFGTLLRHPDIGRFLMSSMPGELSRSELLTAVDEFQHFHLQRHLPLESALSGEYVDSMRHIIDTMNELLEPFRNCERMLGAWVEVVREFLGKVYSGHTIDRGRPEGRVFFEALNQILRVLQTCRSAGSDLWQPYSATEFFQILLLLSRNAVVPPQYEEQAVEVLGWLELHLEDAPVVVIAGCNEGMLPESVNSDPFLPDELRTRLGLQNNNDRYARDLYFAKAIHASRPFCRFVAGRTGLDRSPLLPGRILLSTAEHRLGQRITHFFDFSQTQSSQSRDERSAPEIISPPAPQELERPPESVAVTGLKDYLQCPYRFYLKHVLRLRPGPARQHEMDPTRFGNLVHAVLHDFGRGECRDLTDPERIFEQLSDLLSMRVAREFSQNCLPAVTVQVEMLRYRLKSFARWQADRRRAGWRISKTEYDFPAEQAVLKTDSGEILLKGRVDRVDVHDESSEWFLLDYKTAESAASPGTTHGGFGAWKDLQLPAYLYVLSSGKELSEFSAGYINIARDVNEIGLSPALWGIPEVHDAWSCMHEVAGRIVQQRFWPPAEVPWDDFSFICRSGQFGAMSGEVSDE